MATPSLTSALQRLWNDHLVPVRFHFRRSLAKLPYVPVPLHLPISGAETLELWWSYIAPFYDPARGFFDYWGHDIGDLRFLWKFLKPGMVFFDIGAYHGIYSLVAAKRIGPTGKVFAFEPSPREVRRLRLHFRWNGVRSARAEPLAVGAADDESTFFQVLSGDTTRNGLRPPASPDSVTPLSVKTISLDRYVSENSVDRIDVVKIDVEGAEIEAFRGAARVLGELRPTMICEVVDAATQPWGYPARDIVLTLQQYGYTWFDIALDGTLFPHKLRDSYSEVRNYLAVPLEKCGRVSEGVSL